MLKCQELLDPQSCLNKAAATEPVFVLRATDPIAAQTIRHWATMAEGRHEPYKVAEAREVAEQFEKWEAERNAPPPTQPQKYTDARAAEQDRRPNTKGY